MSWISRDTWDTHHPLDSARFYRFVKAVARYSRRAPSSGTIHNAIMSRWKEQRDNAALRETADHYTELYRTLLEYERTKGFPDPLIECRDIVQYHLSLTARGASNGQYRKTMAMEWGPDWRKKLDQALSAPG